MKNTGVIRKIDNPHYYTKNSKKIQLILYTFSKIPYKISYLTLKL